MPVECDFFSPSITLLVVEMLVVDEYTEVCRCRLAHLRQRRVLSGYSTQRSNALCQNERGISALRLLRLNSHARASIPGDDVRRQLQAGLPVRPRMFSFQTQN
jgi:hypothetical protein